MSFKYDFFFFCSGYNLLYLTLPFQSVLKDVEPQLDFLLASLFKGLNQNFYSPQLNAKLQSWSLRRPRMPFISFVKVWIS